MKTKRIRRKLADRKWLKWRLVQLMKESEKINDFLEFRCNKSFVGSTVADYNTKIWREDYHRNERKIRFIQSLLKKQTTMNTETQDKVIPYSIGLVAASVCADNSLSPEEVEKEFNRVSPSGTTMGWKISTDAHFKQGATNPCPCDQFPETRKHYLFEC